MQLNGSLTNLHSGQSWKNTKVHQVQTIVHVCISYNGSSPHFAQFCQANSSWKSPAYSTLLLFDIIEATVLLGISSGRDFFFSGMLSIWPCNNPVSDLCRQFLWPHDFALIQYALLTVRFSIQRCEPFQII